MKNELPVVAEISVSYKNPVKKENRVQVGSSKDTIKIIESFVDEGQIDLRESFGLIALNQSNEVLGIQHISNCGLTMCLVDVRLLFGVLLKCAATQFIIFHNHPSGKTKPGLEDNKITQKIKEGSKLLDLNLLDHIVYNSEFEYFSYADESVL